MNTNILLVCHFNIGQALLKTAQQIFANKLPLETYSLSIDNELSHDEIKVSLLKLLNGFEKDSQTLILTDVYGATPHNVASTLANDNIRVISGVNLPMLIRIMNYPLLPMPLLIEKALSGGQKGIKENSRSSLA